MIEAEGDAAVVWDVAQPSAAEKQVGVDVVVLHLGVNQAFPLLARLRVIQPDLPAIFVLASPIELDPKNIITDRTGYLTVEASGEELRAAVRILGSGRTYIQPAMVNSLFRPRACSLTPSERRILSLLTEGMTPEEVARQLHVSQNTMKTHLRGVYRKLRVKDRTQAVVEGIRLGLVDSPRTLRKYNEEAS